MALRKYLVFISSTFKYMEDARKAAVAGVFDAQHIPISLDNFAPQNANDIEVIKKEVKNCQIYILLLGPTYGEIPKGQERSYIEIEFELAERAKRWIMVFTLKWEDILARRQELLGNDKYRSELENTTKLEKFYKRVCNGDHFSSKWRWGDTEQIRRDVGRMLTRLPQEENAPKGLVPEPDASAEIVDEVTQNEFLKGMVNAIRSFEILYERTRKNVEAKIKAAQFLAERYSARIRSPHTKGVFFESGSSVAFVAETLPSAIWKRVEFGEHGEPSKRISTNNVLVYLLLWLGKGVPCANFPWGVPEKTYGASYGPIGDLEDRRPNFEGRPLDSFAMEAIEGLARAKLALTSENTSLVITAASGLQLGEHHKIIAEASFTVPEDVREGVGRCFGPHVGSYKNMILKRYLYKTRIPTVLVVDDSKLDCPIDIRKCHFVFGKDLSWKMILDEHPLAICVGCETEKLSEVEKLIKSALPAFEVIKSEQIEKVSALIARNEAFKSAFPEEVDQQARLKHVSE